MHRARKIHAFASCIRNSLNLPTKSSRSNKQHHTNLAILCYQPTRIGKKCKTCACRCLVLGQGRSFVFGSQQPKFSTNKTNEAREIPTNIVTCMEKKSGTIKRRTQQQKTILICRFILRYFASIINMFESRSSPPPPPTTASSRGRDSPTCMFSKFTWMDATFMYT